MFASIVFIIMAASMLIVFLVNVMFYVFRSANHEAIRAPLISFAVACIVVGTIISAIFSRVPLKPIREIILATDKLAAGDFSARINLTGPGELVNLNKSFNHMAEALGSVELLRADFVNNFSHEFKTPIVSISGFAKILKWQILTEEERGEYLDIIISESDRLAALATNILNLSQIENQIILSDVARFNITEQIRRVIALLENRWGEKHIEPVFDVDEFYISGNEEMLNQVWINILDNAIKFSPEYSQITIQIGQLNGKIKVSISDEGEGISENAIKHIFDKFYQSDTSHATKGNGLGLTLARRIVELHKGTIMVERTGEIGTTFTVDLPISQESY